MNEKLKENKNNIFRKIGGITLISLVITIVVLIILASIVIYLSLGNDGIFTRANEAKEATNKQTATEIINLKITTAQMNKYAEEQRMPTLKELSVVLGVDNDIQYVTEKSQIASTKYEVGENPTSIYTKLNEYPYEFEINGELQLASIDGIKVGKDTVSTNNPKGEMRFSNDDNGFINNVGKLKVHSYGIEAEEFNLDGDYYYASATKGISCNLSSKFEIASQIFLDNTAINYMYGVIINLYNKNDIVTSLKLEDCWVSEFWVQHVMKINNNAIIDIRPNRYNASGRYAIVGDGEKVYAYWGKTLLGSMEYKDGLYADKVEIVFKYYNGYPEGNAYVEDLYIGEPFYYRDFV